MFNGRKAVFFDLDGTLVDSGPGITECLCRALTALGVKGLKPTDILPLVGAPLAHAFAHYGIPQDQIEEGIRLYRKGYIDENICLTGTKVFAHIPEMLAKLQNEGLKLFVVTTKSQMIAEKTLVHFDLMPFFGACYGSAPHKTAQEKADTIRFALAEQNLKPNDVVMIGDKRHDIIAARETHVQCIGVQWGYAEEGEFVTYPPDALVATPMDLISLLP